MTTCFNTCLPARALRRDAHESLLAPGLGWLGAITAGATFALAFSTLLSLSSPASAQSANQIWSGCSLEELAALLENKLITQSGMGPRQSPIGDRSDGNVEVAFVVVYSLKNPNDGQPVGSSGFTGPIICTAPSFSITDPGVVSQTTDIPSANILDAEDAFFLRYSSGGSIQKRVCHTVGSNTDCFTVSGP